MKQKKTRQKRHSFVSPEINLFLFSILLIATPFIMLQNYLQHALHSVSHFELQIVGLQIPFVLIIALILLIGAIIRFRRKITARRLIVFAIVILMMALGQFTADYYINYKFYDLQNNWHYFAYGIFVFICYRVQKEKNLPPGKIILNTYFGGVLISSFDEGIQVFISTRIFDLSDCAKDFWGLIIGLIILFFVVKGGAIVKDGWKVREKHLRDYLKNPFAVLVLLGIFTYIFLVISSILTEVEYWLIVILISIAIFAGVFLIIHLSQIKIFKIAFIFLLLIAIAIQGLFFLKYKDENIVYNNHGITVYKGIPFLYFDIIIYPDGMFRHVDKKKSFKGGDFQTFFNQKSDILLIGSGADGSGGKGFEGNKYVEFPHFIFNTETKRGMQLIILKTPEACREFNRLKKEGYNVLFVIHNT